MGFRGCDDAFTAGLESIRENPDGFSLYCKSIAKATKKRNARIEANAEGFLEKYGIRYCPFHSGGLVEDVEEGSSVLEVGGKIYVFNSAICGTWKYCKSPISFDEKLIKQVSGLDLGEVKLEKKFNGCTTCGDSDGRAYLVGFRSPVEKETALRGERKYSNDIPVYLFDRSCGHNHVVMQSFGAPALKFKNQK